MRLGIAAGEQDERERNGRECEFGHHFGCVKKSGFCLIQMGLWKAGFRLEVHPVERPDEIHKKVFSYV
jgi:hypothetical protein